MPPIDFQAAQVQFSQFLESKILGEPLNDSLVKRAQKLADKWWKGKTVLIGPSNIQVIGCKLTFGLGTVGVEKWLTHFWTDRNEINKLVPDAIALGYVNDWQLYIANYESRPHLIARAGLQVNRWSAKEVNIPPEGSPLRVALDRAKALGYLPTLQQGQQ